MRTNYQSLTKEELIVQYTELTEMMISMERELGILKSDKHRTFMRAYVQSAGGNVAAKNRDADNSTVEEEIEIIRVQSEIRALELQRELVGMFINNGE